MKVDGVVVLYNPDISILENINSYLPELEYLFVVDNSEIKNEKVIANIKKINKCIYIDNGGNQGIARALNVGAKLAIEDGADWLLTMDQDSKFLSEKPINKMLQATREYQKIAIISPIHKTKFKDISIFNKSNFSILSTAMTSGNLLNLKVYQMIGNFRDDYFIDEVDHEYCLRVRLNGFIILQCNNVILEHNLGNIRKNKLFISTNHPPIRRYYMTRNSLYTMHMYREFDPWYFQAQRFNIFLTAIKIILSEKNKFEKLKMIYKGYKDFKKGKIGKINSDRGRK